MSPDSSNIIHQTVKKNIEFSILLLLGFFILLYCLYSTVSFEITCSRDEHLNAECTIVPHSVLLGLAPIKVEHPIAVDIVQKEPVFKTYYGARPLRNGKALRVVMRGVSLSCPLILIRSYNHEKARSIADPINHFLQNSSSKSFHASFPEGRVFPLRFNLD